VVTARRNQRQSRWIRNRSPGCCLPQTDGDFLPGGKRLRCNGDESLGRDLAVGKAVNSDPVAGVSRLLSGRVRDRTDRSVQMFAIRTENEAEKIALVHVFP